MKNLGNLGARLRVLKAQDRLKNRVGNPFVKDGIIIYLTGIYKLELGLSERNKLVGALISANKCVSFHEEWEVKQEHRAIIEEAIKFLEDNS